jgi:hypothetical protein
MKNQLENRTLKVCSTCRHWSYRYKGLCARLNQGVGKFWSCAEWLAEAEDSLPASRPGEAAGSTTP